MERISREQLESEFGVPGVQNARMMDLVTVDPESGKVVLVMIERRAWGADERQLMQIEEKINRYIGYVIDGFLAEHYPQYQGKHVRIRLDCAQEPHGVAVRFVHAAKLAVEAKGIEFVVNVTGNPVTA